MLWKKNHTNVKKVGHTSEFPFDIYWWTLKNPKILNFEKNEKKMLEISSFYTCVPKTTIIWGTVTEIRREKEFFVILDHFLPFYPHNNPENQNFKKGKKHLEMSSFHTCAPKTWSYDVCLLRYGVQQTWFFVILGHFCSFTPISKPKI